MKLFWLFMLVGFILGIVFTIWFMMNIGSMTVSDFPDWIQWIISKFGGK